MAYRFGEGFHLTAPSGGTGRLVNYIDSVGGGFTDLTSAEADLHKRARLLCSPENGARWDEAKKMLEKAGFEVLIG